MDEGLMDSEVLGSLCCYDRRNPLWFGDQSYEDADVPPRQHGCGCDNCFYGRDKLAMEILRLRALLESTRA